MEIKLNKNTVWLLGNGDSMTGVSSSDGFWYDITRGGYFKPEDVMGDPEQITEMKAAIALVQQLEDIYNKVVEEF